MQLQIRPAINSDTADLIHLSLLAWEPVFASFRQVLGPAIYAQIYPDWQQQQCAEVELVCADGERTQVWIAMVEGIVAGFIAYRLNHERQSGEVWLLAVHPDYQNRGIGTDLNHFALAKMKESGMRLAEVGTGGDAGHATGALL